MIFAADTNEMLGSQVVARVSGGRAKRFLPRKGNEEQGHAMAFSKRERTSPPCVVQMFIGWTSEQDGFIRFSVNQVVWGSTN
jgi:hypothetical protein